MNIKERCSLPLSANNYHYHLLIILHHSLQRNEWLERNNELIWSMRRRKKQKRRTWDMIMKRQSLLHVSIFLLLHPVFLRYWQKHSAPKIQVSLIFSPESSSLDTKVCRQFFRNTRQSLQENSSKEEHLQSGLSLPSCILDQDFLLSHCLPLFLSLSWFLRWSRWGSWWLWTEKRE